MTAEGSGDKPEGRSPVALWIDIITLIAALGVLAAGIFLLVEVWHPGPVAAPFTRVGGQTNVETAVDASLFWVMPKFVVETPATASEPLMLGAAQCAMEHDAPLLFTSENPKRERLVGETISAWHIAPLVIKNGKQVNQCLKRRADIDGLSTLPGPYSLVALPSSEPTIPTRQKLASEVVFVAAFGPGFAPDVAVGMALAAHMTTLYHQVSLVIVPRYLEADPTLEGQLEDQAEEVTGGVVLGQTMTIPEDTRALLRQLLTSTDRQGLLAQIQANLGSVGPVMSALLALFGLGASAGAGRRLAHEVIEPTPRSKPARLVPFIRRQPSVLNRRRQQAWSFIVATIHKIFPPPEPTPAGLWHRALDEKRTDPSQMLEVTVWLRSGTKIVGTEGKWYSSDAKKGKDAAAALIDALLRLDDATITRAEDPTAPVTCQFVLVPVADIELIAGASPAPTTAASPAPTTTG